VRRGITGARAYRVGDLEVMLSRDHAELDRYVRTLLSSEVFDKEWWQALDGARLAFAAHAEASERVLNHVLAYTPTLRGQSVDSVLVSHRAQEELLHRLSRNRTDRVQASEDAIQLRAHLLTHDEHERLILFPALRRALEDDEYQRLAGLYAKERVNALGQMRTVTVRTIEPPAPRPDTDIGLG
jgi:hypothetical protein